MASLTGTFTQAQQASADLLLAPGQTANIVLTQTGSAAFAVRVEERAGAAHTTVTTYTADQTAARINNDTGTPRYLRLLCTVLAGGESIAYTLEDVSGESVGGLFPIVNSAGTVVFDVSDDGIEAPLVTATTLAGTLSTAAQANVTSLGTLTALQVDNVNINGNTISSTAGTDLNITPLAGQQIVLDGAVVVDAGVVTGVTDLTATTVTGNVVPPSGLASLGTGVTATEFGVGGVRYLTLTLTNVILPIVSVTTGNGVGGFTLATLGQGYIYNFGAVAALSWSVDTPQQADFTDDTPEGDLGIGTLAPANADALGTDATDDNLATAAAITATAYAGTVNLAPEAPLAFDGSGTAQNVVLTGLIDAADIDDDVSTSILVSGTVSLAYINRGDV